MSLVARLHWQARSCISYTVRTVIEPMSIWWLVEVNIDFLPLHYRIAISLYKLPEKNESRIKSDLQHISTITIGPSET